MESQLCCLEAPASAESLLVFNYASELDTAPAMDFTSDTSLIFASVLCLALFTSRLVKTSLREFRYDRVRLRHVGPNTGCFFGIGDGFRKGPILRNTRSYPEKQRSYPEKHCFTE